MGVPRLFRLLHRRYPCVLENLDDHHVRDFDNFYLDLNGIIHMCSKHKENVYIQNENKEIFDEILHYIEALFNLVQPKKLFFLAVDGVAPQAKMNNQRGRRFKRAKEVESEIEKLIAAGKPVPEDRFDSACISPGTAFMEDLHNHMKYFFVNKISTDPLWQNCKLILSGHKTPGEGEHKIMDYIRYMRSQPDFDPHTKHCLYGSDADLILLGLSTHEPNISILREEPISGKAKKKVLSLSQTKFCFIHLSVMRDYLDLEFQELKNVLPFEYNLEHIINDWILMSFFFGNDFIPNLPNFHIHKNVAPVIMNAYKEILPTLEGYVNENGYLNLPRFQKFLTKLSEHDTESFKEVYANLSYIEEKRSNEAYLPKDQISICSPRKNDLEALIKATEDMFDFSDEELFDGEEGIGTFQSEFCLQKKHYYAEKLHFEEMTEEISENLTACYLEAVQWTLFYYFHGCPSWTWHYPYHYSPFISDITNFKNFKIEFEKGVPLLPFDQLMGILPASSKDLLPECYGNLMTSPDSPLIEFFPKDFQTDLNSKEADWEALVLIPFVNQKKLLEATTPLRNKLNEEEKKRNAVDPFLIYTYTEKNLGTYSAPKYFPDVAENHAVITEVFHSEILVEKSNLVFGLRPGANLVKDLLFPRLKNLSFTGSLQKVEVSFWTWTGNDQSIVLALDKREYLSLESLAESLLGKTVYVKWPYLVESKVVAVTDAHLRYKLIDNETKEKEILNGAASAHWVKSCEDLKEQYLKNKAIDIGKTDVIVTVKLIEGKKYLFDSTGNTTVQKIWSSVTIPCPLQAVISDFVQESDYSNCKTLNDAFPIGSLVFMLGHPHFGAMGRVLEHTRSNLKSRLKVALETTHDLCLENFKNIKSSTRYLSCREVSTLTGLNGQVLSLFTGNLLVNISDDKEPRTHSVIRNIGLKVKKNKTNERLLEYATKINNSWHYSLKTVQLLKEYVAKFPEVFEAILKNIDKSCMMRKDIFPDPDGEAKLKEFEEWKYNFNFCDDDYISCDTQIIDSDIIKKLIDFISQYKEQFTVKNIEVKPQMLYKSELVSGNIPPVTSLAHSLFDRVVAIKSSCSVPAGLRGVIIGIEKNVVEAENKYTILFDSPFLGGQTLFSMDSRFYVMSRNSFLNISDEKRKTEKASTISTIASTISNMHGINESFKSVQGTSTNSSAFAKWINNQSNITLENAPVEPPKNELYAKMWENLQEPKCHNGTNALKKLLKIDNREEQKIEDPVKSFFSKMGAVAPASSSSLERREPAVVNGDLQVQPHKSDNNHSFLSQLQNFCKQNNVPPFKFSYIYSGGSVVAKASNATGKVYYGSPCLDRLSAIETASKEIFTSLTNKSVEKKVILQRKKDKNIIENQLRLTKALNVKDDQLVSPDKVRLQKITHGSHQPREYKTPRFYNIPQSLPHPPKQWVKNSNSKSNLSNSFTKSSQNKSEKAESEGNFQSTANNANNANNKKSNSVASALAFVPLQVITGKRSFKPIATTRVTTTSTISVTNEVAKPQEITGVVSSHQLGNLPIPPSNKEVHRPRRKIAANLNFN